MSTLINNVSKILNANNATPELKKQIHELLTSWQYQTQPTHDDELMTIPLTYENPHQSRANFKVASLTEESDEIEALTTHYSQTNYQVLGTLGVGGMGKVLKVYDPRLKRNLAMKILHPAMMETPQLVARFYEEAQLIAQMQHPNIVQLYGHALASATT